MFSVLRFILIVGAIFYFSPVRDRGEGSSSLDTLPNGRKSAAEAKAASEGDAPAKLEAMWEALPEGTKQAVVDRLLATSGLGAGASKASDTLLPSDRQLIVQPKGH